MFLIVSKILGAHMPMTCRARKSQRTTSASLRRRTTTRFAKLRLWTSCLALSGLLPLPAQLSAPPTTACRLLYVSLFRLSSSRQNPNKLTPENYIQNDRQGDANPGALGLGQQTATNLSNGFFLLQCLAPLFFATLADMRLGRLKTLTISLV